MTPGARFVGGALALVEEREVERRVLVDGDRPVPAVPGGDEAQLSPPLGDGERLLLVGGLDARLLGDDPDLEEVDRLVMRGVLLAVQDAGARAHALHVAGPDDGPGAHAVLVGELTVEHVGDDLHVAVAVGAEALPGRDAVVVDHA